MLLIADSGSTKCDWMLLKDGKPVVECSTMGFNPYFHDETLISSTLKVQRDLKPYFEDKGEIYFYGAGCSSPELRNIVHRALEMVFPNAQIKVDHDLNASAFATWKGEPEIACILGTGSNSCFFDGEKLYEEVPALAYILGDEGSGSYYGKQLLKHYLYRTLPADLQEEFGKKYKLSKDNIMENVYMRPHANVYLASFMKFCSDHRRHPFITEMIFKGMTDFLKSHVCVFDNYREVETNFVGSVAYYFEDILKEAAKALEINVGHIVKKPITGLANYHLKLEVSISNNNNS